MYGGLNEATCVVKSQFVCWAVKHKQATLEMEKKGGMNQVCISKDLEGYGRNQPSWGEASGAVNVKNCKTLNPFISQCTFCPSITFHIHLHPQFAPFTSSVSWELVLIFKIFFCVLFSTLSFTFLSCSFCHSVSVFPACLPDCLWSSEQRAPLGTGYRLNWVSYVHFNSLNSCFQCPLGNFNNVKVVGEV